MVMVNSSLVAHADTLPTQLQGQQRHSSTSVEVESSPKVEAEHSESPKPAP